MSGCSILQYVILPYGISYRTKPLIVYCCRLHVQHTSLFACDLSMLMLYHYSEPAIKQGVQKKPTTLCIHKRGPPQRLPKSKQNKQPLKPTTRTLNPNPKASSKDWTPTAGTRSRPDPGSPVLGPWHFRLRSYYKYRYHITPLNIGALRIAYTILGFLKILSGISIDSCNCKGQPRSW